MKTSHLFAAVALASLAAAGAQAETYEGVHAPVSAASRADVEALSPQSISAHAVAARALERVQIVEQIRR